MTAKTTKTKLQSSEDWDQYFVKDKALSEQIKKALFSYADMSDTEFKNFIADMSDKQKELFLQKMRGEMNFYKKILQEDFYKTNPKGQRYQEAYRKCESISSKGKLLSTLIQNN